MDLCLGNDEFEVLGLEFVNGLDYCRRVVVKKVNRLAESVRDLTRTGSISATTLEIQLFQRLWEELDFDDHPLHGGHEVAPEGELLVTEQPNRISINDNRVRFYLYADINEALADRENGLLHIEPDARERPASVHLLSASPELASLAPGRMGLHRWSLSPTELGDTGCVEWLEEALGFDYVFDEEVVEGSLSPKSLISRFDLSTHDSLRPDFSVAVWRMLLSSFRNEVEPLLPGWTWHLEVDNKADRTGWYVRAPAASNSLFTFFIGIGWRPGADLANVRGHTFVLFERAPPGELDRPDEAEANVADAERVERICAADGPLAVLCGEPNWVEEAVDGKSVPTKFQTPELRGKFELWPPEMGRWPLLVARAEIEEPNPARWVKTLIQELKPTIDGLTIGPEFN